MPSPLPRRAQEACSGLVHPVPRPHLDQAVFSQGAPLPYPLNEAPYLPTLLEPGLTSSPPGRAQLSSCSEPLVSQFIRKHVASCLLVSDTSTELSYILPSEAAKKGAFERLFQVWRQGGARRGARRGRRRLGSRMEEAGLVVKAGPAEGWGCDGGGASGAGAGLTPPAGPLCCRPHPALLQHLECSLDALHLSSFGLMDTTLEEVFLKVSEEDQSLENSEAGERPQSHRAALLPLTTPATRRKLRPQAAPSSPVSSGQGS